jgi:glycosyltransferase involved in cell wall biosynthesis
VSRATTPRVLWLLPSDPWSKWTLSGISRETCLELKRRDLLHGALSPGDLSQRHLKGPAPLHDLEKKVVGLARKRFLPTPRWTDERDGLMGRVLRDCPPGTIVVYALLRPKLDPKLPIRRFRWMDLSLLDAVRTGSFGYSGMTDSARDAALEDERRMLSGCEGVVSLSTYTAESVARDIGYPRDKITPIGAGPALDVQATAAEDKARFESGKILFVGRDWKRKRGDLIVEALRLVRKKVPHASLTIVGPSAPPIPPENGVHFVGPLNKENPEENARLRELFLESSAFCMASASEPWGLVYVEAAQFGLPVVALNDWALPDIVVDGVTGRLVPSPTAEHLAAGLEDVLRDPARAAQMGRAAKERVARVLSWPAVVDRMLDRLCPEALGDRKPIPLREPREPRA